MYHSETEYAIQDVLNRPESNEFAYLTYRFDDKIIEYPHKPVYVNQIQINSHEESDLTSQFAKLKISRIEQFDAEVKLSFEGREKIKNVRMIDVFFDVVNADESEKKQSIYEEIVERSK